jgi:hypothetical protein
MRNFYVNVIPRTSHFTVGGLGYFGGEISARIVDLMWGKVIPRSTDWERDYRAVYGVVYDGSTAYDDEIVPATLKELRNFRSWLQRLETNDASAKGSTFVLGNLNEGKFLAFTGEIDDPEERSPLTGNPYVHDGHHSAAFSTLAFAIGMTIENMAYSNTHGCEELLFRFRDIILNNQNLSASEKKCLDAIIDIAIVGTGEL